jgi:hypothetical protein
MDLQESSGRDRTPPIYSNYLRVGWNAFEFLLDFGSYRESDPGPVSVVTVVTPPVFAKAFSEALRKSLDDYEAEHGPIPDSQK